MDALAYLSYLPCCHGQAESLRKWAFPRYQSLIKASDRLLFDEVESFLKNIDWLVAFDPGLFNMQIPSFFESACEYHVTVRQRAHYLLRHYKTKLTELLCQYDDVKSSYEYGWLTQRQQLAFDNNHQQIQYYINQCEQELSARQKDSLDAAIISFYEALVTDKRHIFIFRKVGADSEMQNRQFGGKICFTDDPRLKKMRSLLTLGQQPQSQKKSVAATCSNKSPLSFMSDTDSEKEQQRGDQNLQQRRKNKVPLSHI